MAHLIDHYDRIFSDECQVADAKSNSHFSNLHVYIEILFLTSLWSSGVSLKFNSTNKDPVKKSKKDNLSAEYGSSDPGIISYSCTGQHPETVQKSLMVSNAAQ